METPELSILIPTYQEELNMEPLFTRLSNVLPRLPKTSVVLVDDNSSDETVSEAKSHAKKFGVPLSVIVRDSVANGLGQSINDGLEQISSSYVIVMDSDLQHPPESLPDIYDGLKEGDDIVVGSRYVDNGGITDWSLKRRIISSVADGISQASIPDARCLTDPMSGFFGLNLGTVDIEDLHPKGFKILLEIISQNESLQISEVGYEFENRDHGSSNLTFQEYLKFAEHMIQCRWRASPFDTLIEAHQVQHFTIFTIVGLLAVILETAMFAGLNIISPYYIAGIVAFSITIILTFIGHDRLTFRNKEGKKRRDVRYVSVYLVGFVLYEILLITFITSVPLPEMILNATALCLSGVWNFIGCERFVYR